MNIEHICEDHLRLEASFVTGEQESESKLQCTECGLVFNPAELQVVKVKLYDRQRINLSSRAYSYIWSRVSESGLHQHPAVPEVGTIVVASTRSGPTKGVVVSINEPFETIEQWLKQGAAKSVHAFEEDPEL